MTGSHSLITCSLAADLVAKSDHRTPRTAITCVLSLAHGLPNGWVALNYSKYAANFSGVRVALSSLVRSALIWPSFKTKRRLP